MRRLCAFFLALVLVLAVGAPSLAATVQQQNALREAELYLQVSSFSFRGLVEQLEYEGFSTDDAIYAAYSCGADWNEQAYLSAQAYLSIIPFSYSELVEQLEYEGFTAKQAEYGASIAFYGTAPAAYEETTMQSGGAKNGNGGLQSWSTNYLKERYPGVRQIGDGWRENFANIIREGNLPVTVDELYVILAEIETEEAVFRCLDRWIELRNNNAANE